MRPLLALSVVVLVACPSPGGPDGGDDGGQRCVTTEECGTDVHGPGEERGGDRHRLRRRHVPGVWAGEGVHGER
jgi:hypothetical protein